jgi:UDP-glucose 4-epimerase
MSKETWLITGGAGYIGSHVADVFLDDQKNVVIYDSLLSGQASRISHLEEKYRKRISLIVADIRDANAFEIAIRDSNPSGVVHAAALKSVPESFQIPKKYLEVNSVATASILNLSIRHNVEKFIFSSSASVYGSPQHDSAITEDEPIRPQSPYGASKSYAESKLEECLSQNEIIGTSLRYFNVIGSASRELRDLSRANLVPIVLNRILNGLPPIIFGKDYPTLDGTCVRDYVDVRDVARAHLAAANSSRKLPPAVNIGTGLGSSVLEVISLILDLTSRTSLTPIIQQRRHGDPAALFANVLLAKESIGFKSRFNLIESIRNAIDV